MTSIEVRVGEDWFQRYFRASKDTVLGWTAEDAEKNGHFANYHSATYYKNKVAQELAKEIAPLRRILFDTISEKKRRRINTLIKKIQWVIGAATTIEVNRVEYPELSRTMQKCVDICAKLGSDIKRRIELTPEDREECWRQHQDWLREIS